MSNILNFEKKTSSEKELERVRAEYNARPTRAIAGTFNPDLLAGSMARLLLNLGDEINMLGFELMCSSNLFEDVHLWDQSNSKVELEQKLYRWDRRLVDLQDRFDLLTAEPVDCYLDAQYPEGMGSKQLRSWLEKCTAQLNVYFIEMIPFNTDIERQKSLKWSYANQEPEYLTVGEVGRLILGNYQDSEL